MEQLWHAAQRDDDSPQHFRDHPNLKGWLRACEWQDVNLDRCHEEIVRWSREFGLIDSEPAQGIRNVTSEFLERVTHGRRRFSLREVEMAFTGCQAPRRLDSPATRIAITDSIRQFNRWLTTPISALEAVSEEGRPADSQSPTAIVLPQMARAGLIQQLDSAIENHALVLLVGDGGNGKSTLLAQVLSQWSSNSFVDGTHLTALSSDWLSELVANWRNDARFRNEEWDNALARLTGCRNARPVLLLALDALDESRMKTAKYNEAYKLLTFFAREERSVKPPRATLVVTCRQEGDLDDFFVESGMNAFASNTLPGKIIPIVPFTPSELRSLVRETGAMPHLASSVRECLAEALMAKELISGSVNAPPSPFGLVLPGNTAPDAGPGYARLRVKPEVVEALFHPIVWGLFCQVSSTPALQEAALCGDESTWDNIAAELLMWFGRKCAKRCPLPITEREVHRILYEVAAAHNETDREYRSDEWHSATHGQRSSTAPEEVMRQGISSGLIRATPHEVRDFPWSWRHPFFAQFLARQSARRSQPT